jgi:hypothetical protein
LIEGSFASFLSGSLCNNDRVAAAALPVRESPLTWPQDDRKGREAKALC